MLLVDDVIDSGWTVTVLAALLRQAGEVLQRERAVPVLNVYVLRQSSPLRSWNRSRGTISPRCPDFEQTLQLH